MGGATSAWSDPPPRASMTLDSDSGHNDRRSDTSPPPRRFLLAICVVGVRKAPNARRLTSSDRLLAIRRHRQVAKSCSDRPVAKLPCPRRSAASAQGLLPERHLSPAVNVQDPACPSDRRDDHGQSLRPGRLRSTSVSWRTGCDQPGPAVTCESTSRSSSTSVSSRPKRLVSSP
jgi:hypothetical protein